MVHWLAIAALSLSAFLGSSNRGSICVFAGALEEIDPALARWVRSRLVRVPEHVVPQELRGRGEIDAVRLPSGQPGWVLEGGLWVLSSCDEEQEVGMAATCNARRMELEALAWKVKTQRVAGRSGPAAARRFAEELATAWGEGVVLGTVGVQGWVEHVWLYVPSLGLHVDMGAPAGVPRWIDLEPFAGCPRVAAVEEAGVLQVGAVDPMWDGDGDLLCEALRLTVERLDAGALSERVHARCGWEYEATVGGLWIEDLVWPWFPIDPAVVGELYRLALGAWGVDRALEDESGDGESIWAVASDPKTVDVLREMGFEEAGRVPCRVMVKR